MQFGMQLGGSWMDLCSILGLNLGAKLGLKLAPKSENKRCQDDLKKKTEIKRSKTVWERPGRKVVWIIYRDHPSPYSYFFIFRNFIFRSGGASILPAGEMWNLACLYLASAENYANENVNKL